MLKAGHKIVLVFSGGDTEDNSRWETEAVMLRSVAMEFDNICRLRPRLFKEASVHLERNAYNTRTKLVYSRHLIEITEGHVPNRIIIWGNTAHRLKIWYCAKRIAFRHPRFKVKICTYPISQRKIENLKIYLKTLIEILGYVIHPLGKAIETRQKNQRTGRVKLVS